MPYMLCNEGPSILACAPDLRAMSGVTHAFGGVLQVTLDFGLSQQVYAKAKVKDVTSVGLWLGADVMLDYSLEEAKQLLVNSSPHTFCPASCECADTFEPFWYSSHDS